MRHLIPAPANTLEFKGRNGWAKLSNLQIWEMNGQIHVDGYSKRYGEMAPLQLTGPAEEVVRLLEAALVAARELLALPPEPALPTPPHSPALPMPFGEERLTTPAQEPAQP